MEEAKKTSKAKVVVTAIIPIVILAGMIAYLFGPGSNLLDFGVSLPEITIEKVSFHDSKIVITIRNTGPIEVDIVQADVNDRIQPAAIEPDKHLGRFETAQVIIPFEWNEAEPYEIGITVNDGTRFAKSVTAAALSPEPNFELASYFAVIGIYVGIIPVLIGLLWFPFIAKMSKSKYKFFLALTAGLLLFLGIDAIVEGLKISTENLADSFNGPLLVATVVVISFLGLYYSSEKLIGRVTSSANKPVVIALMIAIGIGLHNLGEGLAIGAAISLGEIALSTFLIVGFTIHNTTEGLAIAAPMARGKPMIGKLAAMGMIAGTPAIFGAWMGGFIYSPFAAVVFLSIGAGAIFQVVISLVNWMRQDGEKIFSTASVMSGFAIGMLVMYLTSIFV
ncbi:MAG TPA: divalent cation transporter [Nitrosopumilaceae archaeon]|nr:divalent cation transporter [Nitrosopumilaceae archaeon]